MAAVKSDRRLCVTRDRSAIVEETDTRAAWLLVGVGAVIGPGDVERYGVELDEHGRVVYDGCPPLPRVAAPPVLEPEDEPELAADEVEEDEAPADPPAVDATPSAVALAKEEGVDLSALSGSGKGGRITKGDVQAAIAAADE